MRIGGFPQDGNNWRLDWLGELREDGSRKNPEIRVKLSLLDIKGSPVADAKNKYVWGVTIGHLPLLTLGSVWKNGERVEQNNSFDDEVVISVSSPNKPDFRPASYIFGQTEYHLGAMFQTTCLVVPNCQVELSKNQSWRNGHNVKLVIPCPEIARFYFATTSGLIRRLVKGAATDLDDLVVFKDLATGKKRTYPNRHGELVLALKRNLFDIDAWVIARILGDRVAQYEAQRMYHSIAGINIDNQGKTVIAHKSLFMSVSLPFSGKSTLSVMGKWVRLRERGWAFLALRLVTCTSKFPYDGLILDRENSNRVHHHTGQQEFKYKIPLFAPTESGDVESIPGKEPSSQILLTSLREQENRFTDLQAKTIRKKYKYYPKYRAMRKVVGRIGVDGYSTSGADKNSSRIAPLDVGVDISEYFDYQVENIPQSVRCLYELWRSVRILNTKYGIPTCVLSLDQGLKTSEFKTSVFKHSSHWSTIEDERGKRGRLALWIEIYHDKKWIYVVDLERHPEQNGIYFMAFNKGKKASLKELAEIMELWAIDRQFRASDGLRDWHRESIPHPEERFGSNIPRKIAERIKKRINSGKWKIQNQT